MADLVIGIGEMAVSNSPEDTVKTYALGSCVALILLDPKTRVGGMVHVALPDSTIDAQKAKKLPGYFADTGLKHILCLMAEKGAKEHQGFIVKLVGGASVIQGSDHFEIGKRNVTILHKLLWEHKLVPRAEDVGDTISRTVSLVMSNGQVIVTNSGKQWRV